MKKQYCLSAVVLLLSSFSGFILFNQAINKAKKSSGIHNRLVEEPGYARTTGANEWAKQEYSMTMNPNTGEVPVHLAYEEYKRIRYHQDVIPSQVYWQERGPYNVGGRTRAVMWDPNDPMHRKLWAGGVTGGLWYTDNPFGSDHEWRQAGDLWENLVISCIAYDPVNTQIFYVGTGEGWFYSYYGIPGLGIWKSADGGETWEHLSNTYSNNDFRHVQKIVVHPANGHVYAATKSKGVMRSTNGGTDWIPVLNKNTSFASLSDRAADLEITADGEILASMGFDDQSDGVYISPTGNAGDWTCLNNGSNIFPTAASGLRRIELAVAPSDANVIYALVQDDNEVIRPNVKESDLDGIYKSTDKGLTWHICKIPNLRIEDGDTIYFSGNQTNYDLIAAVHPTHPETILIGGISFHLSTTGGSYWTEKEEIDFHDDHHAIVFNPGDENLVAVGNDGGVYSVDFSSYPGSIMISDLNLGYRVTQFHGCALHPVWGVDYMLGGSQDNGSWQFDSPGMNYTNSVMGADGGYCYIFKNNPSYQIISTQHDVFFLSTNGGVDFTKKCEHHPTSDLISPWDYDESTNTLYASWDDRNIFIMHKFTTDSIVYKTCYSTITGNYNLFYNRATAFKVSPFIDSTVFIGTNSGELYKITNAFDTLDCIIDTLTGPGFPGSNRRLNCIEFGSSENQIIAVFSNYGIVSVWETLDGGASWDDKEGDLPDIPIYWAIYNPLDNRQVLLATELGVYTTEDITVFSPHWVPVNNGLPIVRTRMLKVRESDNLIIAGTYGRGIFSTYSFFVSPSTKILASDGQTGDAFGNSVATNGDYAIVGTPEEDERGDNAGAIYFFEQLNNQWTESAKILANDGTAGDHFGISADMNGNLAIVGADGNDESGSAYIYRLSGTSWNFEDKISPDDGQGNNNFGNSVAIMNEVAVVGAPGTNDFGAIYIYNYQSGNWIQIDKIIPEDGTLAEQFGWAIDFDGNHIIVGSPHANSLTGAAYIYKNDNGWILDKKITADDGNSGDQFGFSVGLDNQNAVVGAYKAEGKPGILDPGAAYVYFNSVAYDWEQMAKLWAHDAWTFQNFGRSVSIYDDYIIVGAPLDHELDFPAGAAYVYRRESYDNWLQQNKLFAQDGESGDWFGSSVHSYGTAAVVASMFDDDNGDGSGSAYIFGNIVNENDLPILSVTPPSFEVTSSQNTINININNNGPPGGFYLNWTAYSLDPWLQFVGDSSGTNSGTVTVSVDENLYCPRVGRIMVRAPGAVHSPREVYIYQKSGSISNEVNITPSDLQDYDHFGWSVDVDGEYAVVGAPQDGEFGLNAGAVYIFQRDGCCSWLQKAKLRLNSPEDYDQLGISVAISGDIVLAGLRGSNSAYLFKKPSAGWHDMTETARLFTSAGAPFAGFGESLDISGECIVIGAYANSTVHFYIKPAQGWHDMTETVYYLHNTTWGALGKSVAIDGDYAVAGAETDEGQPGGAAYVFKNDWNTWGELTKLIPGDGQSNDWFGSSVDIDNDRIIVGARGNAAAYIFKNSGSTWIEEQKLTGGSSFANGIKCVTISGRYALVGAYYNSDSLYASGSAYSFINTEAGWSFSKQIFSSDLGENDLFGAAVKIAGPYTIIGGYGKANTLGSDAGAAYIFCTEGDIVTSVSTPHQYQAMPVSYDLKQNYPNPFNPVTTIVFDLPKPTRVTLKIYTILGEEVTTIVSEKLPAGRHKYTWKPVSLASGIYLYRIESKEYTITKKMILLK